MNIAIVDDQKEFLDIISKTMSNMHCDIYTFVSVFEMENEGICFDLILLDIDMPDCDGIAYSKEHKELKIIFITSQVQRMKEAFGNNVYGFIEKRDNKEKYIEVIQNTIKEIKNQQHITLKINRDSHDFILKDIIYLQYIPYKNISFVYQGETFTVKGYTLKELEEKFVKQFVYIDRGTMINKDMVMELIDNKLYVKGIPQTFTVSSRRKKEIKKLIGLRNKGMVK